MIQLPRKRFTSISILEYILNVNTYIENILIYVIGECLLGIFDKIKTLISERTISISDIEKEIGVSNGTISKWNSSMPKADSLLKVAQILGVSIEYFLIDSFADITNKINYLDNSFFQSADETDVMVNYRKLDTRGKHKIHTTIYEELDRMEYDKQLKIKKTVEIPTAGTTTVSLMHVMEIEKL